MPNAVFQTPTPVAAGPGPTPENPGEVFPTWIPEAEVFVWEALDDATKTGIALPEDAEGIMVPAAFSLPPDLALFAGKDETYGEECKPIPVIRGWPTIPGVFPSIGVAVATENEDGSEKLGQGGFAGDVYAQDEDGTITASAAYYAEPLYSTVIVELVHENRDERDRLHNMIRRRLYPLRHIIPSNYSQVKELAVQSEKQELPLDEQPYMVYVSLFTVEVWAEALIPTTILAGRGITGEVVVNTEVES